MTTTQGPHPAEPALTGPAARGAAPPTAAGASPPTAGGAASSHRGRRAAAALAALLVTVLLLSACSSAGGQDRSASPGAGSDAAQDPAAVLIVISGFSYQVPVSVPAGAVVTVRNEDQVGHTVTSDEPGVFDVAVAPGEETSFTAPEEPGEYPFHCIPHPQMTGTLVVQGP